MTTGAIDTAGLDRLALEAAWKAGAKALREHVGNDMGPIARTALMQVVVAAALPAYLEATRSTHEPVAWQGYWAGAGSINSMTRITHHQSTADAWAHDGAQVTPLFALPTQQGFKEPVAVMLRDWTENEVLGDSGVSWAAGCETLKAGDYLYALPAQQDRQEPVVQCCMCGKKGLSTVEGDGGTECELADGRWTCSYDCYDRATGEPVAMMLGSYDMDGDCVSWLEGCETLKAGDYLYALPTQQGFKEGVEAAAKLIADVAENKAESAREVKRLLVVLDALRALSEQPADPAPSTASGVVK